MVLNKILSSILVIHLAIQSTALPLNQNEKRASYSVINVDGSNSGPTEAAGYQAVTETVTQTLMQTVTMAPSNQPTQVDNTVIVTVTVIQTPTSTPYDDGMWHPPYYEVVDPASSQTTTVSSTTTDSFSTSSTFSPSTIPSIPTMIPTYQNSTQ
jgi:hypothetical protein